MKIYYYKVVKDNKIIYKVSDSSGNTTKKVFDAVIKDDEMPSLILNGDSTIYLAKGNKYEEPGYVAVDNCDGNITLTDLSKLILEYNETTGFRLDGVSLDGADLNCDGKITLTDVSQLLVIYTEI